MSELTRMRELAQQVLAGKVIPEAMTALAARAREQLLPLMQAAGSDRLRVAGDDDTPFGTVSLCAGKQTAKVTDPDAFTAWVARNRPDEVEEIVVRRVRPAFEKVLLDGASRAGEPIDAEGTVMPGVQMATGEPYVMARPSEAARERARQVLQGNALALPGGGPAGGS